MPTLFVGCWMGFGPKYLAAMALKAVQAKLNLNSFFAGVSRMLCVR